MARLTLKTLLIAPSALAWALGVCIALVGCSPALDWREAQAPASGMQGLFPCKPATQTRPMPAAGAESPESQMTLQACEADGASFALLTVPLPAGADAVSSLEGMVRGLGERHGGPAQNLRAVSVPGAGAGALAQRMRFASGSAAAVSGASSAASTAGKASAGQGPGTEALFVVQGTVIHQLTMSGPSLSPEAVETFFSSWSFKP